jgi:hypothetical protein
MAFLRGVYAFAGILFMQVIKRACVAFCAACVASCVLPCIYSIVARSVGFPGAFGAFRGLWSAGDAFGVLCGVYTGRGSSGIYKPVAARAVYPRRVLGPFAGL